MPSIEKLRNPGLAEGFFRGATTSELATLQKVSEMMIVCEQKKTILLVAFLAVLALLPLLPVEPVIAARKPDNPKVKRTIFTNECTLAAGSLFAGEQVITETGILYVKDAVSTGFVEANSDSPISGDVWARLSGSIDLNTMAGSFQGKWIITANGGTFEGSVVGVVAVASISGRFVGFGTNDLRGQKIKATFEGTVNNYVVDLTLEGEVTSK